MTEQENSLEVNLWHVDVAQLLQQHSSSVLVRILTREEQERAQRFHFQELADRFIAGRFFLRHVLAFHLQMNPEDINFDIGFNGKPSAIDAQGQKQNFSFSRSGSQAICGFCNSRLLGVDIEIKTGIEDMEQVAKSIFSDSDFDRWIQLSEPEKLDAFYRSWTRKEAVSKIDGSGISQGVKHFEVPLDRLPAGETQSVKSQTGSTIHPVISDWLMSDTSSATVAFNGPADTPRITYADQPVRLGSHSEISHFTSINRHFDFSSTEPFGPI